MEETNSSKILLELTPSLHKAFKKATQKNGQTIAGALRKFMSDFVEQDN